MLVNIAMVAGKITSAMYLEDILAYGNRHAIISYCGVEHHSRYARRILIVRNSRHHASHHVCADGSLRSQLRQRDVPQIGDQAKMRSPVDSLSLSVHPASPPVKGSGLRPRPTTR